MLCAGRRGEDSEGERSAAGEERYLAENWISRLNISEHCASSLGIKWDFFCFLFTVKKLSFCSLLELCAEY